MGNVKQKATIKQQPLATPCLCAALRQASRAVTRIYDAELRETGLRSTQHSLLRLLSRTGEVRKGDLGDLASLDETTLTRSLRPLVKSGWVTIRAGLIAGKSLSRSPKRGSRRSSRPARRGRTPRNACSAFFRPAHGIRSSRSCRVSRKPLRKTHLEDDDDGFKSSSHRVQMTVDRTGSDWKKAPDTFARGGTLGSRREFLGVTAPAPHTPHTEKNRRVLTCWSAQR